MRLASLFGLKARLRRLRIMAGEGALALEDRAQLIRIAFADERERLRSVLLLLVAVTGLTTVAIALLSVAIVVQFWDTPYRTTAAWLLAALWVGLWIIAAALLMSHLRKPSAAFEPVREVLEQDMAWFHANFGSDEAGAPETPRDSPPPGRDELLARVARQRMRIATLQDAAEGAGEAPVPRESPSAMAMRVAREHPIATGMATTAVIAVLGPRRVLRWAATIAPIVWRMR